MSTTPRTPLRRALTDVRAATALAPARPAYTAGLRAAMATVAPLVVAHLLAIPGGTWLSLAGFTGTLANKGGPYRMRAASMGALTLAGTLAVALGTLSAGRTPLAVPLTFFVAVACSLARVWGSAGASVGTSTLNLFVIALAFPPENEQEALTRAGLVFLGGLWAMLVSLVLWPLSPYRPVRLAVAACYRVLALYAADIGRWASEGAMREPSDLPPVGVVVRRALEDARAALAATRRGVPGESGPGERLVVLREIVDQLFGNLLALAEGIETIPRKTRDASVQARVSETLRAVAASLGELADRIEADRDATPVAIGWDGSLLRRAVPAGGSAESDDTARHLYLETAELIDRLAQYTRAAVEMLGDAQPASTVEGMVDVGDPESRTSPLAALRAVLAPHSVILRFALRLGFVAAVAVWLTGALDLKRGYWVTITIVIILQPYTGATTLKAMQRVLGTVVGGALTALLGALFHGSWAILGLAFLFSATCVALLPLNYAAFSVFLTPTFVLLAEANAGDWHLAGLRIVNTLLGGALALTGAHLLWPAPEWDRLPSYMAASLRANRDYLHAVIQRFADRSPRAGRALREARRQSGLAVANADESFQRLLGEQRGRDAELAPLMTFLTYTRRLTASTAALAVSRHTADPGAEPALRPFTEAAERVLDDLASAVIEHRAPAP
ncbi:MAG: FUSC family protein, partial [Gemmatimonadales bacterium]